MRVCPVKGVPNTVFGVFSTVQVAGFLEKLNLDQVELLVITCLVNVVA